VRDPGGFSYVEVLVASVIIALSLVPALEALQMATLGGTVHESTVMRHRGLTGRMEEVLAERFGTLEAEEIAAAGGPTVYSDAPGTPDRLVVLLSRYDGDDVDSDPFTDTDDGLLWVHVEVEGTADVIESLTTR
jgi:hypothetical protein